ncbi:MAG TPA: cupin domain-containing protein [Steroidobacteraceae bacterium]|nr:cupin domain-containing protein [Steroidobacteraceae bacterium]
MQPLNIESACVFLDADSGARSVPIDADFWPALMSGRLGPVRRLVSSFSYDADWPSWERHPAGEELVMLLEGDVELVLETEGGETRVVLTRPGSYVLVPTNTWHTAKVRAPSRMFFITPGEGTENRRG